MLILKRNIAIKYDSSEVNHISTWNHETRWLNEVSNFIYDYGISWKRTIPDLLDVYKYQIFLNNYTLRSIYYKGCKNTNL